MSKILNSRYSRRNFLRMSGAGLAAAGIGSTLQACAVTPAAPTAAAVAAPTAAVPSGMTLKMSWWGEQEAPGMEGWIKASIEKYKLQSGNTIVTTLQDTSVVISEFQTASAANSAPDIQYFWNGIYHMESVWLDYVEPLNGLISNDILLASNATPLSTYQGKQYRMGFYGQSPLWLCNRELFDNAGLNADEVPKTWDNFLNACDKLKSKGITPICGGLKDGPWGEWYMGHGLGQNLDSPADALNLFAASLDWRESKYWEHWAKLEELWKKGFMNDDMNSIDLYPGIDLFGAGKGAMTSIVTPLVPKMQKMLGSEKIAPMVFPVFGKGRMAGKPIIDTAGIGISSQSKNKEVAADFLKFLLGDGSLRSMFKEVGVLPAINTWDGAEIQDTVTRQLFGGWVKGDGVPYISNLMPTLFWTDAMFVNSQKIISGEFTGEQAGDNAQAVATKWREQNPDFVEKYSTWTNDLKG